MLMFIAILVSTAKIWTQTRYPSVEQIKKIWHTYKGVLLSHKKNGALSFSAKSMEVEIIMLNEISRHRKARVRVHSQMWKLTNVDLNVEL
jgi:hypothetical protein